MRHAVNSTPDGTVVVWVDSDVLFVQPHVDDFYNFVRQFDIVYIPLPTLREEVGRADYQARRLSDVYDGFVVPETGVFSFTTNGSTRAFLEEARNMYEGLLLRIFEDCYCDVCHTDYAMQTNEYCNFPFANMMSTSNDLHVFGRLLYKHMFDESDLKQGWFVSSCDDAPRPCDVDHALSEGAAFACSSIKLQVKQHIPVDSNCVPRNPKPKFISPFNLHYFFHHFIDGSGPTRASRAAAVDYHSLDGRQHVDWVRQLVLGLSSLNGPQAVGWFLQSWHAMR
eukprot:gnl/TRDRNA2_/TRDRNA2_139297_c0_seq1.p1 gnl/TRDRNA2_/TRDRNA2_139297_c0~~gnl/TRDRNA2_/TRDRNA2_139297_c0_seq1.p1  ORF type:complete len:310 (+),score=14.60 gnl/TRDRNA2_/TRDRNA2_139297_c0_seq1:90-932(+)